MDIEIDENMDIEIDEKIKNPKYYETNIRELDQRFNLIMNELTKHSIDNQDTTNDEKNIQILQNDLFLLKNSILRSIDEISKQITRYDIRISDILKQNKILKNKYNDMLMSKNGSKGLVSDNKVLYNEYLIGNLIIGLAIFSSFIIYQKYLKRFTL